MNTTSTELHPMDAKLRDVGNALIKPDRVRADWPEDFFDQTMRYAPTKDMTQGQKMAEFRRRALYSTLRALAYEKVLKAQRKRMRAGLWLGLIFALVWGGLIFAVKHKEVPAVATQLIQHMVGMIPSGSQNANNGFQQQ